MNRNDVRIAIVGATGLVGQSMLQILSEQEISAKNIRLFASEHSAGMQVPFRDTMLTVQAESEFQGECDVVFGFCSNPVTKAHREKWESFGVPVIDNSSAYRLDLALPLVVPEVNPEALLGVNTNWYPNPNCSTIQMVRALQPLRQLGIEEITVASYQSVSGAGRGGIAELHAQRSGSEHVEMFQARIEANIVPWIATMDSEGNTTEETKLRYETRKILGIPNLPVYATCARVPVEVGHGEAVFIRFREAVTRTRILTMLRSEEGLIIRDEVIGERLPTQIECVGSDDVFVGRVRVDPEDPHRVALWVVGDNLRVGAATNAYRIFEQLLAYNKIKAV
ncbi:MAG: aspartate-semialdehyde dehydrogenase [bacterium]|nr:aspartate-semialdehyde dehydrogenase [bacterium]